MSHAIVLTVIAPKGDPEKLVAYQMEPFDENGEWFRNGSRWDWWVIGGRYEGRLLGKNIVKRSELNRLEVEKRLEAESRKEYQDIMADKSIPADMRPLLTGIKAGETEDDYVAKHRNFYFYAFLRNRTWHENDRLGFWGGTAATECERVGKDAVGKCLAEDKETGAKVICWKDPEWPQKFWPRFIEHVEPDERLVIVDYHV